MKANSKRDILLEYIPYHVIHLDENGMIIDCHIQESIPFFAPHEDVLNTCLYDFPGLEGLKSEILLCLKSSKKTTFDFKFVVGEEPWLSEIVLTPVDGGIILLAKQVSTQSNQEAGHLEKDLDGEKREFSSEFKEEISSIIDGQLVIRLSDLRGIHSNTIIQDLLNYSEKELSNKKIHNLIDQPKNETQRLIDQVLKNKESRFNISLRQKRGNSVPVECTAKISEVRNKSYLVFNIRDRSNENRNIQIELFKKEFLTRIVEGRDSIAALIKFASSAYEQLFQGAYFTYSKFDNKDQKLHLSVYGDLPTKFRKIISTVEVDSQMPMGGRSAFFKKTEIIPNISESADWEPNWEIVNEVGIKGAYSVPFISQDKQLLGVFNIFYKTNRSPSIEELNFINEVVKLLSLLAYQNEIAKNLAEKYFIVDEQLLGKEHLLNKIGEIANVGGWEFYLKENQLVWTDQTYIIHELPVNTPISVEQAILFYHPDFRSKVQEIMKKCLTERKFMQHEAKMVTAKGKELWVSATVEPVMEKGEVVRLVGALFDITDRKNAEYQLRKSQGELLQREDLLNKTGEIANVGGWSLDLNEMKIVWTKQTYHLHEVDLSWVPDVATGINFYHPDDQQVMSDAVNKCINEAISFSNEARFITAKNNERWVVATGIPVIEQGKVVKLIGAFRDITDFKNQEIEKEKIKKRLQNAYKIAKLGHWDWNVITDEVHWSNELYDIYGISRKKTPKMGEFENIIHPDSKAKYHEWVAEALNRTEPVDTDLRIVKSDSGELCHISVRIVSILGDDGNAVEIFGVVQDVTERYLLQSHLSQMADYNQAIIELNKKVATVVSVENLVDIYCNELINRHHFDVVCICLKGDKPGEIVLLGYSINQNTVSPIGLKEQQHAENLGPTRDILESGTVIFRKAVKSDSEYNDWGQLMSEVGVSSFVGIPIKDNDEIKGSINVYSTVQINLDNDLLNFLFQLSHEFSTSYFSLDLLKHNVELHEFNQLLLDSLDGISVSVDTETGEISLFGKTEPIMGMDYHETMHIMNNYETYLHPASLEKFNEMTQSVSKDSGYFDFEFKVNDKTGHYVWLNALGKIYSEEKIIKRIVCIIFNVNDKKNREEAHVKAQIIGRDDERRRMAKEIHDSLGQSLTVASMTLAALDKDVKQLSQKGQQMFKEAYEMINNAIDESRDISHALMPSSLLDLGLIPCIQADIARLNRSSSIEFNFFHHDIKQGFDIEIESNLYSITREAISNIIKHSNATNADIQLLLIDNMLVLSIEDNGKGYNEKNDGNSGIGLSNIRSRVMSINGELYVESEKGTQITVELEVVPLK